MRRSRTCNSFDDCAECRQQDLPERDENCGDEFILVQYLAFSITCHQIFFDFAPATNTLWTLHVTRIAQVETLQQYAA